MRHLWLASEDAKLNCIWQPLEPGRRKRLDEVQGANRWGAWFEMTDEEKRCYRYTRLALEIFEQAWEVRRRRMIGEDTWCKWEQWLATWSTTRYFPYVLEDSRPRLLAAFCDVVDEVVAVTGPGAAPPASSP